MSRLFCYILFILLMSTTPAKTQDLIEHDPLKELDGDLVIYMLLVSDFTIRDIVTLSELNKAWAQLIDTEFLWQRLYSNKLTHAEKVNANLSFQDNFKLIAHPSRVYFISPSILLDDRENLDGRFRVVLDSGDDLPFQLSDNELTNAYAAALTKHPRVICPSFGFYQGEPTLSEWKRKFLDKAKEMDILLVFCAGNSNRNLSSQALPDGDIHEQYPNALWITAHDENFEIPSYANHGSLVELAFSSERAGTGRAAVSIGKYIGNLRSIRPDLSAEEIRNILVDTADRTDKVKQKLTRGGIFNEQAALNRLRKQNGIPSTRRVQ